MYKKKSSVLFTVLLFVISVSLSAGVLYFLNTMQRDSGREQSDFSSFIPIIMVVNDDNSYASAVSVSSALKNKDKESTYEFYFLCSSDFTDLAKKRLSAIKNQYKDASFNFVDATKILKKFDSDFGEIDNFPDCKLCMPTLLPDLRKVIFVGPNAVINKDLCEFFNTNVSDVCIAGVKDESAIKETDWWRQQKDGIGSYAGDILKINSMDQYVNASVLLVNLANMRKQDIENKCQQYYKISSEDKKSCAFLSQDALNSSCFEKILLLEPSLICFCDSKDSNPKDAVAVYYPEDKIPLESDRISNGELWWDYARSCSIWNDISEEYCTNLNMNVFLCADDGNAFQTCTTIASLLDHTSKHETITIHIIGFSGKEMSRANKEKFDKLKKIRNFNLNFMTFGEGRLAGFVSEYWNKSILIKLFAPEIFKNLSKIMWSDDDIIFTRGFREIYKRNMNDKCLGSIDLAKFDRRYHLDHKKSERWITAGIGIYDLNNMRKNDLQKEFLKHAKEYPYDKRAEFKIIGGVEEYAFTKVISDKFLLLLPYRDCIVPFYESMTREHFVEQQVELANIRSIHYSGPVKPWKEGSKNLPLYYYGMWRKYLEMTPFKGTV
ncbi:MAG: hypothetical protein LBH37_04755 [Oscillospiraceae bacterium]|jgi:lipopolysaccharide biosynthesis glycosyltransferase|nr:hypothetical protein [Oscillospiraceae bacterium]